MRVITCHDFDAFSQTRLSVVFDDDVAMHTVTRIDHEVQRVEFQAIAVHLHKDRLLGFAQQVHHRGSGHAVPLHHGHAVVGFAHRAAQAVADPHAAHLHRGVVDRRAVDVRDVHLGGPTGLKDIEELADAFDGCEAPILLLARRHGEIGQIE